MTNSNYVNLGDLIDLLNSIQMTLERQEQALLTFYSLFYLFVVLTISIVITYLFYSIFKAFI